jgi:phosphoglycolate phosphatase
MSFSVLIFDLDGTLVDSSVDIANAINYAAKPYGIRPVTVRETVTLVGEGVTRLFEKVMEREGAVFDINVLIERFLDHYTAHIVDNTLVYPGVVETLDQLPDLRKAVISNKREALCVKTLESLGLADYFDLVIGSDTVAERKPSPLPLLHALEHFGAGPAEAAIVGDSVFDIEAGKAAGITTIAVTYGFRPRESLAAADYRIDSMPDLVPLLRNMQSSKSKEQK